MINTLLNQDFVAMDKFRLRKIFGKITEIRVKMNKTNKSKRNDSCMGYFLSSPFSSLIADLAAGGSAGEFASLALDKRDSLESKLLRASSEKKFLFAGDCIFIEPVHRRGKSGSITNNKELKILGKGFKNQMKENKFLTLKLCQKKRKIKKTKY